MRVKDKKPAEELFGVARGLDIYGSCSGAGGRTKGLRASSGRWKSF